MQQINQIEFHFLLFCCCSWVHFWLRSTTATAVWRPLQKPLHLWDDPLPLGSFEGEWFRAFYQLKVASHGDARHAPPPELSGHDGGSQVQKWNRCVGLFVWSESLIRSFFSNPDKGKFERSFQNPGSTVVNEYPLLGIKQSHRFADLQQCAAAKDDQLKCVI